MLRNNSGNITSLGLLVVLLASSYLILLIFRCQTIISQVQNRKEKYLCLKSYLSFSQKYVSQISKLNLAIQTAHAGTFFPATAAASKSAMKGFQIAQDVLHISYLKNLTTNSFCSKTERFLMLTKLPYKTIQVWKLKRNITGITKVRKKEWKIHLILKFKAILVSHLKLKGALSSKIKSTTWELP